MIEVSQHGAAQAARTLAEVGQRAEDPRPALREIIDQLAHAEDLWWRSSGQGTWPPLARVTIERKRGAGLPIAPLLRTSDLRRSLAQARGAGGVRRVSRDGLDFGTRVPYARFHEEGRGNPKRAVLVPMDEPTRLRIRETVEGFVAKDRL